MPMPKRQIELVCPVCNTVFQRRPCDIRKRKKRGTKLLYCSLRCAGKAHRGSTNPMWKGGITKRPPLVKIAGQRRAKLLGYCERCGSTENLHGHHKLTYSSSPLFGQSEDNIEVLCAKCHSLEHPKFSTLITRPIVKTGVTISCKICDKNVYSFPSRIRQFCSRSCKSKWLAKKRRKGREISCKICGRKRYISPSQIGLIHTCGSKCNRKWIQRKGLRTICKVCKEPMYLAPSRIGLVHCCSPNCHSKWFSMRHLTQGLGESCSAT